MVDAAEQRHNMVESQIRPSEISDRRIIRAMQEIAREPFLPDDLQPFAYADRALQLPVDIGTPPRFELAPRVMAKLIQAADIAETDVVLLVGAASGYAAGLLSRLCDTVIALEEQTNYAKRASDALATLAIDTVAVVTVPLHAGYAQSGPYDVIVVPGAVSHVPAALLSQLKDGGRLVAVLQQKTVGQVCCWRRVDDTYSKHVCFDATVAMLPGFESAPEFSL